MNILTATEKHFGKHNDWGLVFLLLISAPNFSQIWMKHLIHSIYVYDEWQVAVRGFAHVYALSWPWQILNFQVTITTGIQNQPSLQNSTIGHEICAQWKYCAATKSGDKYQERKLANAAFLILLPLLLLLSLIIIIIIIVIILTLFTWRTQSTSAKSQPNKLK